VSDLLYVGRATTKKFLYYGIKTIGDLAASDVNYVGHVLGKNGYTLWYFANGLDVAPVRTNTESSIIKSIGNSTTTPKDLVKSEDVKITLYSLSESVAARLREHHFLCRTVQITIRDLDLFSYQRQVKLRVPTSSSDEIFNAAFSLYLENHLDGKPIRSLGVRAENLLDDDKIQLSFLPDINRIRQKEDLERTIDMIRGRFGHSIIKRGVMLLDDRLARLDAKTEHIIHPVSYFR
jgi:DNA polymerase-4